MTAHGRASILGGRRSFTIEYRINAPHGEEASVQFPNPFRKDLKPMDKLLAIRDALALRSLEREEVINGLLAGLLAGHHVLLLGPPGTDKSRLIRMLCSTIEGSRYFGRLLTKFTHPDELFGPLDVMALERGEYRRVMAGRLPEAEVAFLDEVFKAGSAILNALLELMNERTVNDGTTTRPVPLRILVGASNELPNPEDGLSAFADRFLLRYRVDYVQRDESFDAMLALLADHGHGRSLPTISREELATLTDLVAQVDVPTGIRRHLAELRKRLRRDGVVCSDRRWRQTVDVLRAHALLHGHATVELQDFDGIIACLWTDPGDIEKVTQQVQQIPNFVEQRLQAIGNRVQIIQNEVANRRIGWIEARTKLNGLRYEVDRILAHVDPANRSRADREAQLIRQAIVDTARSMKPQRQPVAAAPSAGGTAGDPVVTIELEEEEFDIDGLIEDTLAEMRKDGGDDGDTPGTPGGRRFGSARKPS